MFVYVCVERRRDLDATLKVRFIDDVGGDKRNENETHAKVITMQRKISIAILHSAKSFEAN